MNFRSLGDFLFKELSPKTFILSHLALLLIGLSLAGTLGYFLHWAPQEQRDALLRYLPVSKKPASLQLEVKEPVDETITFKENIIVSGTTAPGSSVIISTQNSDWGVETDNQGYFSKVIDLEPGLNSLIITTFDKSGDSKVEARTIYYSEEAI